MSRSTPRLRLEWRAGRRDRVHRGGAFRGSSLRGGSLRGGFTLIELLISMALILILLSVLVPALSTARTFSHREKCADNLTQLGRALQESLERNGGEFPFIAGQAGWHWGGVRYSSVDESPFLDYSRPLNRYLSPSDVRGSATQLYCCPADRGITTDIDETGTGRRTACRSFGTSYRANPALFDAQLAGIEGPPGETIARGLRRAEIITSPSRLLVLGDAVWHEAAERTGRRADWHGQPNHGNILFLDGSVRFREVRPRGVAGPVVLDPIPRFHESAAEDPADRKPAPTSVSRQ